jgi:serine/threonine protein kinase
VSQTRGVRETTSQFASEPTSEGVFPESLGAKYEYRRSLGQGGMGKVVLARHRQLDQLVAIKFLRSELIETEFLSRFSREARTASKIRSEHVVRVMDVGVVGDRTPFIVMEYLEGEDLSVHLAAQGRLAAGEAIGFVLQALDALAEAHVLGIVHRDLKPANLFVTRDRDGQPFVKVLDFGLAKRAGGAESLDWEVTQPGTLVGSPCYMPPEQLIDAKGADARSDIWALGASLFELLTGQPPFQAPTMPQLYTKIVHGKVPRVSDLVADVPRALDDIVATCLKRSREDRYEHAGALRAALSQIALPPSNDEAVKPRQSVPPSLRPLGNMTPFTVSSARSAEAQLKALGILRRISVRPMLLAVGSIVALAFGVHRFQVGEAASQQPRTPPHESAPPKIILAAPVDSGHATPGEQVADLRIGSRAEPGGASKRPDLRSHGTRAAPAIIVESRPSPAPPAQSIYDRYP